MSRDRLPLEDSGAAEEPPGGQWSRVLFLGDDERRRGFAHAVLARLAAAHPAERMRVVLHVSPRRRADWAWTRWLPQTRNEAELAARPAFATGTAPTPEEPLVVVVLDSADADSTDAADPLPASGLRNTVVLDLDGRRRRPGRTTLRLDAGPNGVRAVWMAPDRTERSAPLPGARAAAALTMPEEFVLGHAFSSGVLGELVEGTARAIGERRAASGTARAWQGPRLFILVDDYEKVRDPAYGPLEPLLEYLTMGYELGAHLVVASSDAETAAADPLLRGLHEAGAGVLMLTGPFPGRARYHVGDESSVIQTALAE